MNSIIKPVNLILQANIEIYESLKKSKDPFKHVLVDFFQNEKGEYGRRAIINDRLRSCGVPEGEIDYCYKKLVELGVIEIIGGQPVIPRENIAKVKLHLLFGGYPIFLLVNWLKKLENLKRLYYLLQIFILIYQWKTQVIPILKSVSHLLLSVIS